MKNFVIKFAQLVLITILLGWGSMAIGMSSHQALSVSIFAASILGTLFFWDFRLSFAFLGTSVLLMTRTIDMEHLIKFSSLDVILFLVGMMVLIGALKEEGFFSWIVRLILRVKNLNAYKFIIILSASSMLLACAVDEVTSIIFVVAAIFAICDYFGVESTPFIIISVLATNVGSAGTVLGNPIGILIASKSGLTFEDFIIKAFPLAIICLTATIAAVMFWYRKPIAQLNSAMKKIGANDAINKIHIEPPSAKLKVTLAVFLATLILISLHRRLELLWNLAPNTILLIAPLISSGCVMIWKWRKARTYIERDVEWWTLVFFLLLFAQAGALKYTGATDVLAGKIIGISGNINFLIPAILWMSAIGSSILDNVVLVAAFIPIIQSFQSLQVNLQPLWWALLFGGCLGGNITLIGSTANIVAIGILEKEKNIRMTFLRWFGIGLTVGVITSSIVWLVLVTVPWYR